jgi:hypothetical protein
MNFTDSVQFQMLWPQVPWKACVFPRHHGEFLTLPDQHDVSRPARCRAVFTDGQAVFGPLYDKGKESQHNPEAKLSLNIGFSQKCK